MQNAAAITIQSGWRGHLGRKEAAAKKEIRDAELATVRKELHEKKAEKKRKQREAVERRLNVAAAATKASSQRLGGGKPKGKKGATPSAKKPGVGQNRAGATTSKKPAAGSAASGKLPKIPPSPATGRTSPPAPNKRTIVKKGPKPGEGKVGSKKRSLEMDGPVAPACAVVLAQAEFRRSVLPREMVVFFPTPATVPHSKRPWSIEFADYKPFEVNTAQFSSGLLSKAKSANGQPKKAKSGTKTAAQKAKIAATAMVAEKARETQEKEAEAAAQNAVEVPDNNSSADGTGGGENDAAAASSGGGTGEGGDGDGEGGDTSGNSGDGVTGGVTDGVRRDSTRRASVIELAAEAWDHLKETPKTAWYGARFL
jgi:hypothetical protein